jgi:MFS family permease
MGMAQAGIFPASAKAIGAWFPTQGRAFASGLLASSMAVGAALAPAITAQLLLKISWQTILLIYAIPGMTWALLFFWLIPESSISQNKSISKGSLKSDWQAMLGSVSMLLLCLQQFLRAAAMVFFSTWFTRFLEETKEITTLDAGRLTAWAGIGVMLGGISGGTVSDWVLKKTNNKRLSRQGLAVISMTLCSLLFVLSHFISDVHLSVFIMALGAYCGAFGGISGYSVAIDFGGSRIATVFSVMNMCGNIGAGLFPLIIGKWIQMGNNWSFALFLFAGIFAIDAVIWALLNPKKSLFDTEEE